MMSKCYSVYAMNTPASLLRDARRSAGLTQTSLAARLGTTQSAVARLETEGANPRVETLQRALSACNRELELNARPRRSSIDETLVARQLQMSPADRLRSFEHAYGETRRVALAGQRARGELA
jgi:transcriptional regulator with XRE-family HTH domain